MISDKVKLIEFLEVIAANDVFYKYYEDFSKPCDDVYEKIEITTGAEIELNILINKLKEEVKREEEKKDGSN